MATSAYKGTNIQRHRRTDPGHRPRHSKSWLGEFLASFTKSTPAYSGRHRNDRSNVRRGIGSM